MSKYQFFELAEFIKSDTAKKKGIDNTPTFEIVDHLDELVATVLEPLRAAYGKPIKVSSGYRCKKLNDAVKGAATSVHMIGYAADLQVSSGFNKFRDFVVEFMKDKAFDQILLESNKSGTKWIHIGLFNNSGQQRRQVKVMEV